jgi:DNA-binding transcriptional regulator YhcF (GntR family)
MVLDIDVSSAVPPYEQIRSQISDAVALGLLERGGRLPTIRQLAADLGLAPGTIARAYRELESAGLIVSRGRHGTFVADRRTTPPAPERRRRIAAAAASFALEARRLGIDSGAALDAARAALYEDP